MSLEGKRVVVLSDNDLLARAIELNLNGRLKIRIVAPPSGPVAWPEGQAEMGDVDLIVVALSSPSGEPLLALARVSLADQIGQVPLLIISDRPFDERPDDQIAHLGFPFQPGELQAKVKGLLQTG